MGLIKNIKQIIKTAKINQRINRAKIVHIMFNDKFNKPFVDFLNKNFNQKEHLVLCKRIFDQFPFPDGENVIEIKTLKNLNFDKVEKIICHSLFDNELVDYMFNHQNMLKQKVYWVMWGGDLYGAPKDEKNDFVRKNVYAYCAVAKGDEKIAQNKYSNIPKTFVTPYLSPISADMLINAKKNEHDSINIQLNNSCDGQILEMLDILSKYKNENINIRTILSYGDLNYKEEIITKGKEIFGNKFSYIDKLMEPKDFCDYMAQNNILVFNQKRQQGIGNISMGLALGAKVYISSEVTTFGYINDNGFKVFDTNEIKNMSYNEFIEYSEEEKINNINCGIKFYQKLPVKEWKDLFEYEESQNG